MPELLASKTPGTVGNREKVRETTDATRTVLLAATIVCALTLSLAAYTAVLLFTVAKPGIWTVVLGGVGAILVVLALATALPLFRGYTSARQGTGALRDGRLVDSRRLRFRGANSGWVTLGSSLPISIVSVFVLFLLANDHAVQTTFFDVSFMAQSLGDVAKAFTNNIIIAVTAEMFVLVLGLVIAIARMAPGPRAGRSAGWPPPTSTSSARYPRSS